MRTCLHTWLLLVILLAAPSVKAQPKIITIDTITRVPSETLPFHRPFFLKILIRKDEPVGISLFEHLRNRSLSETIVEKTQEKVTVYDDDGKSKIVTRPKKYHPTTISAEYFSIRKEGEKNYLYINFRDTIALQPARQYTIAVYYQVHPDAPRVFRLLHQADSLPSDIKKRALLIRSAVDEYNKIAEKGRNGKVYFGMIPIDYPNQQQLNAASTTDFRANGLVRRDFPWITDSSGRLLPYSVGIDKMDSLIAYYQKRIKPAYKAIDSLTNALKTSIQSQASVPISSTVLTFFNTIGGLYLNYDTLASSKIREMYTQDNNRGFRSLTQLSQLSGPVYFLVGQGLQPLLCEFCKPADLLNYAGRIKNLEETISDVQRVRLLTQLLTNRVPALVDLDRRLKQVVDDLTTNRAVLKTLIANEALAVKAIGQNKQFESTDFTGGDTFVFNFETRTKYSLVPEIGVVSNWPFGKSSNYLLMPYIGATINFTPLDRDVPYYLVRNKKPWQHFGLILGYTLVSLKDSTANPPRDNFFEKSAFVTGLSYRLSNTVKTVAGFTWLYKRTPETGMRTLNSLPFVGISFDIDVKKYVADLFGAVTSLKGSPSKTVSTSSQTP